MESKRENREQKEPMEAAVQFPEETVYLQEIERRVDAELLEAQKSVDQMEEEQRELQKYMAESRGETDFKEMFQTERIMRDIATSGSSAVQYLERLKKVRNSPYFARIEFLPSGEGDEKTP